MEPMANIALRAARLAGTHIARGFDRPDLVKVNSKGHNNLVTNMDTEAEQIIAGTLLEKYPDHKITGEESGSVGPEDADYEWIIDPIDGTMNYARQIPHFCISIGCLHKGRQKHGVILDPMRQEEFVASRGQGARLNGRRLRVSGLESLDGAVLASSGFLSEQHRDEELALIDSLLEAGAVMRQQGSAALELAYLAAGRIDALWMRHLSKWDIAAGALLVTEAGGLVGDFAGGANYMRSGDVIAGTPKCFKLLTGLVKNRLG
ncbi:MAG: inositol monophosphatase family protein [Pseudomonadales bacterium]